MTELILTSVQEAALNAFEEAVGDLGFKRMSFSLYAPGEMSHQMYVHGDVVTATGEVSVSGSATSVVAATRDFLNRASEAIDNPKPRPLRNPSDVKNAVTQIVDEARNAPEPVALDEIADRIAALAVAT